MSRDFVMLLVNGSETWLNRRTERISDKHYILISRNYLTWEKTFDN